MPSTLEIAIIIGSTRPTRIGPSVAKWVLSLLSADETLHHLNFTTLDLASFPLPAFNEPTHPMTIQDLTQFASPATIAWNQEIAKYSAYILISPEYHSGIPGALKNAIDHLYHAWTGKPAMIVTYGIFGGAQAYSQLHQVLGVGCRMKVVDIGPKLEFPGREGENNASPALFQAMAGVVSLETLEFWGKEREDVLAGCHQLLRLGEA